MAPTVLGKIYLKTLIDAIGSGSNVIEKGLNDS